MLAPSGRPSIYMTDKGKTRNKETKKELRDLEGQRDADLDLNKVNNSAS